MQRTHLGEAPDGEALGTFTVHCGFLGDTQHPFAEKNLLAGGAHAQYQLFKMANMSITKPCLNLTISNKKRVLLCGLDLGKGKVLQMSEINYTYLRLVCRSGSS